jgi:hypothetical protein
MKSLQFVNARARKYASGCGLAIGTLTLGMSANAALDPSVASMVAGIESDFGTLMTVFYGLATVIISALVIYFLVIRLTKRTVK